MARALIVVALCASAAAFAPPPSTTSSLVARHAYVPDGMSAAQWKATQAKEKAGKQKNLGSADRTAKNMPVFFAKEKLARGEITKADIPYMQRGGSWDNSDIKGIKGWFTTENQNGRD